MFHESVGDSGKFVVLLGIGWVVGQLVKGGKEGRGGGWGGRGEGRG